MKTLLLMRHAKSSWKHPDLPDQDRPLNKRGEKDAPRMGKYLKEKELVPQVILASPAKRIKQTVDGVLEKMPFKGKVSMLIPCIWLNQPRIFLFCRLSPIKLNGY
jgi:phosphohistidine phosphatase